MYGSDLIGDILNAYSTPHPTTDGTCRRQWHVSLTSCRYPFYSLQYTDFTKIAPDRRPLLKTGGSEQAAYIPL